jgi:hypothetical protein
MADRDAFGNEPGGSSPAPVPGPAPVGVPSWTPPPNLPGGDDPPASITPSPAPAATQTPFTPSNLPPVQLSNTAVNRSVGGGRSRSGMSVVFALLLAAVIIGVPVFLIAKSANDTVNHALNNAFNNSSPSPSSTSSSSPSSPSAPSHPSAGLASGSMVLPAALASFVKHDVPGNGKLVLLRVAPDRLVAITRTSTGGSHTVNLDYAGNKQIVKVSSGGFGSEKSIPLSKIDAQAPARMIKHVPRHTKSINYLVLGYDFNGNLQWSAYYKNSNHYWAADAHGHHVHQAG